MRITADVIFVIKAQRIAAPSVDRVVPLVFGSVRMCLLGGMLVVRVYNESVLKIQHCAASA